SLSPVQLPWKFLIPRFAQHSATRLKSLRLPSLHLCRRLLAQSAPACGAPDRGKEADDRLFSSIKAYIFQCFTFAVLPVSHSAEKPRLDLLHSLRIVFGCPPEITIEVVGDFDR